LAKKQKEAKDKNKDDGEKEDKLEESLKQTPNIGNGG